MSWRRVRPDSGDVFPGYADIVEIGSGSVATVFRARDLEGRRPVALKMLHADGDDDSATAAFESESLALGTLGAHPNVVTLHRTFHAADGSPVLVLELCRGTIADELGAGHAMPVADVAELGVKIAGALETAHRAGVVHRDVRPENLLVTYLGEPALADFTFAALDAGPTPMAPEHGVGPHVAPELLEGEPATPASDVYALASTLYELIAGRPAPRDPVPAIASPHVPEQLSDLLVAAMAEHPADRPQSAAAFATALSDVAAVNGWPRTTFVVRTQPAAHSDPVPAGEHGDVPTWAVRTDATPPAANGSGGAGTELGAHAADEPDLSFAPGEPVHFEPSALRRRVTLRSGPHTLVVDDTGLVVRGLLRRREIGWADVRDFEASLDGAAADNGDDRAGGQLVAITREGSVDLPATRRRQPELAYVRALLDAYLQRARTTPSGLPLTDD